MSNKGGTNSIGGFGEGMRNNKNIMNAGAKNNNYAMKTNQEKFKPQYQPSPIDDDLTFCKFCSRRYNEDAYKKHAPGCERRFKEKEMKNKGSKGQNPYQSKPYGKK